MIFIFRTLAGVVTVYSLLCVIRIIMTWIPGANYSGFGRFLSGICDPFLNIFSGIRFLRLGPIDFSPILAFAVLSMLSLMLNNLAMGGRISFAMILMLLIQTAWSIVASVIMFLIIVLAIRLIVHLMGSDNSMLWSQIDSSINPFVYSLTKFFSGGKPVAYKTALIVAIIVLVVLRFGGGILIGGISRMCLLIPF